jgi:hypothetical protein
MSCPTEEETARPKPGLAFFVCTTANGPDRGQRCTGPRPVKKGTGNWDRIVSWLHKKFELDQSLAVPSRHLMSVRHEPAIGPRQRAGPHHARPAARRCAALCVALVPYRARRCPAPLSGSQGRTPEDADGIGLMPSLGEKREIVTWLVQ